MKNNKENKPVQRNAVAESLRNFRSSKFQFRTEERQGASNKMDGYMSEYLESQEDGFASE